MLPSVPSKQSMVNKRVNFGLVGRPTRQAMRLARGFGTAFGRRKLKTGVSHE